MRIERVTGKGRGVGAKQKRIDRKTAEERVREKIRTVKRFVVVVAVRIIAAAVALVREGRT